MTCNVLEQAVLRNGSFDDGTDDDFSLCGRRHSSYTIRKCDTLTISFFRNTSAAHFCNAFFHSTRVSNHLIPVSTVDKAEHELINAPDLKQGSQNRKMYSKNTIFVCPLTDIHFPNFELPSFTIPTNGCCHVGTDEDIQSNGS